MSQPKPNKGSPPRLLAGQARPRVSEIDLSSSLMFCFDHLALEQGQTFEEWEREALLSVMLRKFKDYSNKPHLQCFNPKFKSYKCFPMNSEFKHPKQVPQDAIWTVMHIKGKECVVGHIFKNVFFVVFLDKEHKFYPSDIQDRGK